MPASTANTATCPRSWGEFIPGVARIQLVVVVTLVALVYWNPIRQDLMWKWQTDGNWSHGWLVPVFSLYFLYTHREDLFRCKLKPSFLGAAVIALSLMGYLYFALWAGMTYPQLVSLLGVLFGLVLLFGGWALLRIAWFPIAFLLLAMPLPEGLYVDLTLPLRRLASLVAASAMELLTPGLYTEAQGVVIDYMGPVTQGTLNVEEACSGMRLMMAFVTLGVAMAYLGRRPFWQRLIMVLSCIPIAVFCNAVRVTTTGLFQVHGHEDLAKGTPHQLLGIGMLVLALGLYSALGFVLSRLFVEVADEDDTDPVET